MSSSSSSLDGDDETGRGNFINDFQNEDDEEVENVEDSLEFLSEEEEEEEDSEFAGNDVMNVAHPDPGTVFGPAACKKKPGIVYLSSLPPGFNVSATTAFFAKFGKVGRVFLQPETSSDKGKGKKEKMRHFTEGWIEFLSKRTAQEVADNLNTTQVGGKKRAKSHDVLWNIKYLPRFKWSHLTERLNYEKAVHHQKMRHEIVQAKREAEYFKNNVEKSKRMRKNKSESDVVQHSYEFRQKETDETIRSSKRKRNSSIPSTSAESPPPSNKKAKLKKNKGKGKKSGEFSNVNLL